MKTALRVVLGLLLWVALLSSLQAQSFRTFVASFGNDANDGSRSTPKRMFQAAHDAVATGGEVVALDSAGFGALTITKSISIIVPPGVNGFITVTGDANGVTITAAASDRVTLRGLILEGGGGSANGRGIHVDS